MHELSVAKNIIDIASQYASQHQVEHITGLDVEVGDLSGVVMEALEFAMEEAVKNTLFEGATIHLIPVPGQGQCADCHHTYHLEEFFRECPACGSFNITVIQGKELRVKSMHVED